jgi:hypothetical protein
MHLSFPQDYSITALVDWIYYGQELVSQGFNCFGSSGNIYVGTP